MRVNVYGNDLRDRVEIERKTPRGTEVEYIGIHLFTGPDFHHTPGDDDTASVAFWYHNEYERKELLKALEKAVELVKASPPRT